jgi:hypothetical protein
LDALYIPKATSNAHSSTRTHDCGWKRRLQTATRALGKMGRDLGQGACGRGGFDHHSRGPMMCRMGRGARENQGAHTPRNTHGCACGVLTSRGFMGARDLADYLPCMADRADFRSRPCIRLVFEWCVLVEQPRRAYGKLFGREISCLCMNASRIDVFDVC